MSRSERPCVLAADLPAFGTGAAPLDGASRELLSVLMAILDAFAQPAWLLTRTGRVVHANASAGALEWVPTSLGGAAPLAGPAVERVRVEWRDVDGWVVVMSRGAVARSAEVPTGLPPRLAATAGLLSQGMSDKEVAEHLGVSHATARTYVARVYRRLGVHRRAELFAPPSRGSL